MTGHASKIIDSQLRTPAEAHAQEAAQSGVQGGTAANSEANADPRDARIEALKRERAGYQSQAAKAQQEVTSLKERMAQLEGVVQGSQQASQASQSGNPLEGVNARSWTELDDGQLQYVVTHGDSHQIATAQQILAERAAEKRANEIADQRERGFHAKQHGDQVAARIATQYPDARNQESELWQLANQQAVEVLKFHGEDAFERVPELQELCFARASTAQWSQERERLLQVQKDYEELKRQVSMEGGGRSQAHALNNEAQEALGKGDVQTALRSTGLAKSFGN